MPFYLLQDFAGTELHRGNATQHTEYEPGAQGSPVNGFQLHDMFNGDEGDYPSFLVRLRDIHPTAEQPVDPALPIYNKRWLPYAHPRPRWEQDNEIVERVLAGRILDAHAPRTLNERRFIDSRRPGKGRVNFVPPVASAGDGGLETRAWNRVRYNIRHPLVDSKRTATVQDRRHNTNNHLTRRNPSVLPVDIKHGLKAVYRKQWDDDLQAYVPGAHVPGVYRIHTGPHQLHYMRQKKGYFLVNVVNDIEEVDAGVYKIYAFRTRFWKTPSIRRNT